LDVYPLDEKFLSALESGLPVCSGVALGIDRLLMAMHELTNIDQAISFTLERV
jgi:elongation factor P--(R)-beta-lysine ligase